MRTKILTTLGVLALAGAASYWTAAGVTVSAADVGPQMTSIGPLTFGPDGVLFAADAQAATIYALELGDKADGGAPGAQSVDGHRPEDRRPPRHRRQGDHRDRHGGASAHEERLHLGDARPGRPTASRRCSASTARARSTSSRSRDLKHTKVDAAERARRRHQRQPQRDPRRQSITDMAFSGRPALHRRAVERRVRLEAARRSSIRSRRPTTGTSVEIFHGNHGQFETRSPVYAFVPYTIDNTPHLIAGYLCTPLVKFPVASLQPGAKVVGTTIAELGNRNRPIDMIVYKKDGRSSC